ncbi:MAG: glycosyltransferase [Myxococcales bacterium]|nr:glycosyltransferase [Myxococcales bacterium]
MSQTPDIVLSVVAPMHNEQAIAAEFVRRCCEAVSPLGVRWELIVCDDASTDGTFAALLKATDKWIDADCSGEAALLQNTRNLGQIGATLAAIRQARGTWIAVLDGDLQDPPETIADLWHAAQRPCPPSLVFATKSKRDDPAWFIAGRTTLGLAQRLLGATPPPRGAGSFCLIPRRLARRVAQVDIEHANLAPLLMALVAAEDAGSSLAVVRYVKAARYDDKSRVGPVGLVREAAGSMMLSGAAGNGMRLAAGVATLSTLSCLPALIVPPVGIPLVVTGGWVCNRLWRATKRLDERRQRILNDAQTIGDKG